MESRAISDSQISASSQLDDNHSAKRARLNIKLNGTKKGGWSARILDRNQWLQIDLGSYTTVTLVATQGRNGHQQWVTTFRLQYSNDGIIFHLYRERGDTSAKVRSLVYLSVCLRIDCRNLVRVCYVSAHALLYLLY